MFSSSSIIVNDWILYYIQLRLKQNKKRAINNWNIFPSNVFFEPFTWADPVTLLENNNETFCEVMWWELWNIKLKIMMYVLAHLITWSCVLFILLHCNQILLLTICKMFAEKTQGILFSVHQRNILMWCH